MQSRRSCLGFTEDTPVSVSVTADAGVVARFVLTACGQEKLLPTLVDAEVAAGETVEFERARLRCNTRVVFSRIPSTRPHPRPIAVLLAHGPAPHSRW
jgi:hypothetical protein